MIKAHPSSFQHATSPLYGSKGTRTHMLLDEAQGGAIVQLQLRAALPPGSRAAPGPAGRQLSRRLGSVMLSRLGSVTRRCTAVELVLVLVIVVVVVMERGAACCPVALAPQVVRVRGGLLVDSRGLMPPICMHACMHERHALVPSKAIEGKALGRELQFSHRRLGGLDEAARRGS
jgi:hypothetical protein